MKKILIIASFGALVLTSATAQADHAGRKRKFMPSYDRNLYLDENEDDGFVTYDDEEVDSDVIYINRRERMMREAEAEVESDLWWLEDAARQKLENRNKTRKTIIKKAAAKPLIKTTVAKPKTVAAVKPVKPVQHKLQTASVSKPVIPAKPKQVATAPKPDSTGPKTIGCTAGAAVVTGYGFGEVRPKACTGTTYAYLAARAGKSYEIKMTAASGEIVDVKKLN